VGHGSDTVHIYPNRIHIGGRDGQALPLSPEQSQIANTILDRCAKLADKKRGTDDTRHMPS
jgi:hypothetical protein